MEKLPKIKHDENGNCYIEMPNYDPDNTGCVTIIHQPLGDEQALIKSLSRPDNIQPSKK